MLTLALATKRRRKSLKRALFRPAIGSVIRLWWKDLSRDAMTRIRPLWIPGHKPLDLLL